MSVCIVGPTVTVCQTYLGGIDTNDDDPEHKLLAPTDLPYCHLPTIIHMIPGLRTPRYGQVCRPVHDAITAPRARTGAYPTGRNFSLVTARFCILGSRGRTHPAQVRRRNSHRNFADKLVSNDCGGEILNTLHSPTRISPTRPAVCLDPACVVLAHTRRLLSTPQPTMSFSLAFSHSLIHIHTHTPTPTMISVGIHGHHAKLSRATRR